MRSSSPPSAIGGSTAPNPSSGAASAAVASAGQPASSPDLLGFVPENLFLEPPDPITLDVSTSDDLATEKRIGPDGGSVTATGRDGTVYTLSVPANSLPLPMPIGMTPGSDVSGFPAEFTPTGHLGVVLAPDGLAPAATATLTVHPTASIEGAAAVVDFEGRGAEAGLHVFDRGATDVTISIDHFSGYIVEFPVTTTGIRSFAQRLQDLLDKQVETDIAAYLGIERQKAMFGEEDGDTLLQLAEAYLVKFKNTVAKRVAEASC